LNSTSDRYTNSFRVTIAEAGTITLRLKAVSQAQAPMFSWAGLSVAPDAESVTITLNQAKMAVGAQQMLAAVVGYEDGSSDARVNWSVSGATSTSTTVLNGLLMIGDDETATSVTVTAASVSDPDVNATLVVPIIHNLNATGTASVRCVAGKAVVTLALTNSDTVTASVSGQTDFGAVQGTMAAGKKLSILLSTRVGDLAAGSITLSATGAPIGDAEPKVASLVLAYPAKTC
jgi:hypothetical protein